MDISKLQDHLPDFIYNQIPQTFPLGVDGPKRLSNLLGQCKLECGNWTAFTENLNYSGEKLWVMFHTHFSDINEAQSFAHQPERIANRIYASRNGNGPESSGEGWYYRGRGCVQLTGKTNIQAFFTSIGLPADSDPNLIATNYQLISAAWYFKTHNLWALCDRGTDLATITAVTQKVNGGQNGLQQRVQYTQEFYQLLT